jgi:hypothetical protein
MQVINSNLPLFSTHNECGDLMLFDYLQKCNGHIIFINYEYLCLDLEEIHNISPYCFLIIYKKCK